MSASTKIAVWGVGLLLLAPLTAWAQERPLTRQALPNGMRVLVRENHQARVVAISLQVRAGSVLETAETAGITNFLQRVMIRGTARHSASQLAEAAEEIGGSLEASGDVEYGEVRGRALARQWQTLLRLIAEVVLEPTLLPDEVERERRLILGGIQTRADNPFLLGMDALMKALYDEHPYSLPSVGLSSSIARLTRDQLRAHHRGIYQGDRIVLAVSGDVEAARVVRIAEGLFAGLPGSPTPLTSPPPIPLTAASRRVLEKPAQQVRILIGHLCPGVTEPDFAAVRVLGTLVGGGMSSRLFVELRDQRGLAYVAGSSVAVRGGPSYFVSFLGTEPSNAEEAEAGMRRELERVVAEGVSEEELARAKAYLLGDLAMDRRTNARDAWYLAFFELIGVGADFPERHARAIDAVTLSDVRRVAPRYLTELSTIVVQPRR